MPGINEDYHSVARISTYINNVEKYAKQKREFVEMIVNAYESKYNESPCHGICDSFRIWKETFDSVTIYKSFTGTNKDIHRFEFLEMIMRYYCINNTKEDIELSIEYNGFDLFIAGTFGKKSLGYD